MVRDRRNLVDLFMEKLSVEEGVMRRMATNADNNLWELSFQQPILLVFLRHFGCTFCREALADIAKKRAEIEARGTKILFVHMTDDKLAERYFNRYDLQGIEHISDSECEFYTAFGLMKGNFTQLFGLQSWIRGFQAGVLNGHGAGIKQMGDGFQMPGVFAISEGEIREAFIHKLSHSRPDYLDLVNRCCEV